MQDLKNKVSIVTGGAQGIGREFARALVAKGAKVVIADLSDATALVQELGEANAVSVIADITNDDALNEMTKVAEEKFGYVNVLINNAGLFTQGTPKSLSELDHEDWDKYLNVNVRGLWQASKAVLPSLERATGGSIINIGSASVFTCPPGQAAYIASKGAVHALTRAMARELGPKKIRANVIAPSLTISDGVKSNPVWEKYTERAKMQRTIQRDMLPSDLVGTCMYLASDVSDFVTGQTFNVDGGAYFY